MGWVYFPERMPQDCSSTVDCVLHKTSLELSLPPTHLCGSELVTQQDIGDKDGNGDNNRECCPQVHAQSIQVTDGPQLLQLFGPAGFYPGAEVLLPGVKLDHTDATQELCH